MSEVIFEACLSRSVGDVFLSILVGIIVVVVDCFDIFIGLFVVVGGLKVFVDFFGFRRAAYGLV